MMSRVSREDGPVDWLIEFDALDQLAIFAEVLVGLATTGIAWVHFGK
jgi:hypothetical protein